MKHLTKPTRRLLAALLAVATVLGVLVPVTLPTAGAKSLAEYEQEAYFRNGASPMDASPKIVTLSDRNVPKPAETNTVISLDGTWKMTCKGKAADLVAGRGWDEAIDATVPGSIYTALMAAGELEDPYMGDNMKTANRQSQVNWYFRRTFTYNGTGERVELAFDGLCNVADVYLNGKKIASHEGMFGGPYVDVTGTVRKGENTLVVHLYPAKDFNSTVVFNCSYGWHYAKLYPLGIWQSVTVRDLPSVTLDSPFITTTDYKKGTVDLAIELDRKNASSSTAINGELTVVISPKNFEGKSYTFKETVSKGSVDSTTLRYRTNIPDVKLWWPNGYGEQNLYWLEVTFKAADGTTSYSKSAFGVRQLDYKAMPSGENQNAYNRQFVINGVDVYMKGAGWCTIDSMMRFEREDYDRILSRARDAGINYFRAWGGGLVETDEFYDLCDEYGLCVYQEWPCAWDSQKTQPENVLYETIELGAKRLRNRASLVVWGGGNEGVAAFTDRVMNNIGKLTYEYDGTRDFWRQDGGVGGTNITHDHIHWSGASPEHYLKTYSNFLNLNLTEYGLACMMNYESIQKFATEKEVAEWPINQKGTIAYHTATFNGMLGWTPSPHGYDIDTYRHYADMFIEVDSLQDLITGSQMAQAQSDYLPAINARINAPYSTANVVYKLNDNYPGASWSIVDWYGSPKMSYYLMQDAYRPLMAAAKMDRYNTVNSAGVPSPLTLPIHILDDVKALTGKDWKVTVTAYDETLGVVKTQDFTGKSISKTSEQVGEFSLTAAETAHTPLIITIDLFVNGKYENRTYAYLNFESDPGCLFYLPRTNLTYSISGNELTIQNTGSKPAVGVQVLAPATSDTFVTEDNFFFLNAGETVTLTVSNGKAVEGVTAYNLADAADKVAPTAPTNLNATDVKADSVTLTWNPATDEVGLFGYSIKLDGGNGQVRELFVRDNKSTVTVNGLSEVTSYTVSMEAVDNNGNRTPARNTVTFKTGVDTIRPSILQSTMAEDGTITLSFSTPMNKTRAENVDHYMADKGLSVKSATLSADGLTVTLKTEGYKKDHAYTLGVVNLTDTKQNQNNLGYATVLLDASLALSMDFEPAADGNLYTDGKLHGLITGSGKDITTDDHGHSGKSLTAGSVGLVEGVDFTFGEGKTISLWVRGKAGSGFNVLFAKGAKTNGHFEVYTRSGQLYFYSPEIGDLDMKYNMNSLGDGWHNLTFVWSNQKLVTYADGRKASSISLNGQITAAPAAFSVGGLNDGSLVFGGAVDTVRLYDRVLTEAEITAASSHQSITAEVQGNDVGKTQKTDFDFRNGSTVNLWFKADNFNEQFSVLLAKGTKSTNRHFELYTEAGIFKFYAPAANNGNPIAFSHIDLRAYVGAWHMLTLVRKDDQFILYIDGTEVAKADASFTLAAGEDNMVYGCLVEHGMDFAGAIAEGELLTEALTPADIRARYEKKLVRPEGGSSFAFEQTLVTLLPGESAPLAFSNAGKAHSITLAGDSVRLGDNGTVTAEKLGDTVIYAISDDGNTFAAMVVRVTDKRPDEGSHPDIETETLPDPDTEPDTETGNLADSDTQAGTNAATSPEGETPASTAPATNPETNAPKTRGCKSAVSASALLLLTLGGACLLARKKRD